MVSGNNPLAAIHVAKDVEIIDHNTLFLDLKEDTKYKAEYVVYCCLRQFSTAMRVS